MKNLLYVLILFLPLFLFSCASKPALDNKNLPENTDLIADSENTKTLENSAEETIENSLEPSESEEESITFDDTELSEIDEPEIIDLEPEEEIVEVLEIVAPDETPAEEEIEAEIIPEITTEEENKPEYNISVLKDESIPEDVINNIIDTLYGENINISIVEFPDTTNKADSDTSDVKTNEVTESEATSESESHEEIAEVSEEDDIDSAMNVEPVSPSRSISLKKMEYLDVTYPGKGWIYMGTIDNDRDYITLISGRKLGSADSNFQFQALNAGTKILHFYKDDSLTGNYIDDYLEVVILKDKGSNQNHVKAPDFKMPVNKKSSVKKTSKTEETTDKADEILNVTSAEKEVTKSEPAVNKTDSEKKIEQHSNVKTSTAAPAEKPIKTQAPTYEASSFNEDDEIESVEIDTSKLLNDAKSSYNNKKYSDALNKLNQFLELSTKNRDEALYLKAQILEAPGDLQNITEALSTYQTLTKNYAASKYWDRANKRIIYIKRFYLEGR